MAEHPLPEGPLLIVSPHLGDAALSCAALLDRHMAVTVLDVFTSVPEPDRTTSRDRRGGFSSARDAAAAREAEEGAAFVGSDHEVLAVDLLEQQYRPVQHRDQPRSLQDQRRFSDALLGWVNRYDSSTVAVPAGAGFAAGTTASWVARAGAAIVGQRVAHVDPDHVWVRDATVSLLRDRSDVALWLYDETPQRWSRRGDAMVGLVETWTASTAQLRVFPIDRKAKAQRLASYQSQLPTWFRRVNGKRLVRRLPDRERYWVLEAPNPATAHRPTPSNDTATQS